MNSFRALAFAIAMSAVGAFAYAAETSTSIAADANTVQREIEAAAIRYFLDNASPKTGLVRDRAANFGIPVGDENVASIAATGFGLAVLNNAADRGLLPRNMVYDYNVKVLRFCRQHVSRHRGWFLHFIDWETGARLWHTEYSTIDTALFVAGALYAGQVFPNSEVATIAHELYLGLNFEDLMTDGGSKPDKRTLSMAYLPETGYTPSQWNMYAEQKLLLLLGLGHPLKPLPVESWTAFSRDPFAPPQGSVLMGLNQALFVHQYSELYVDFRNFRDKFGNYFSNSELISSFHRAMVGPGSRYKTFQEGFWGLSAGDSPEGYSVWTPSSYTGTVCIGCTIASAMFMTDILADAAAWRVSGYPLWGRYGFVDSLNVDRNWFSQSVLGITVGPAYLSLANLTDSTSVWRLFMQIPEIQRAIAVAQAAGWKWDGPVQQTFGSRPEEKMLLAPFLVSRGD